MYYIQFKNEYRPISTESAAIQAYLLLTLDENAKSIIIVPDKESFINTIIMIGLKVKTDLIKESGKFKFEPSVTNPFSAYARMDYERFRSELTILISTLKKVYGECKIEINFLYQSDEFSVLIQPNWMNEGDLSTSIHFITKELHTIYETIIRRIGGTN